MNTKNLISIGLALALTCAMAVKRHQQVVLADSQKQVGRERRQIELTHKPAPLAVPAPINAAVVPPEIEAQGPPPKATVAAPQTPPADVRPDATPQQVPITKPSGSQKAPALDPLAREALSYVGADPEANAYWATAINNPDLPDDERKDLIEDLNEDGLSDPKHPALEDMALIANRIQIIQELAPYAMDQVNADAFAEAYKDLVNMLNGRPVQ